MNLPQTITSRSNARVKTLRASFQGDALRPGDILGIEGEHLIGEAVRSGMQVQAVFVREGCAAVLDGIGVPGGTEVVVLSRDVFASAVETASPQGVAATVVVRWPERSVSDTGVSLVVENLQDPGNMGTLIRSAEAFGANEIFVTERTVNQWNPKVVRASAGSVFRIPVVRASLQQIAAEMESCDGRMYAAVAQQEGAASVLDAVFARRCVLMVGNEGAGLSDEALSVAQHRVWIPCAVESLNAAVAGSALLFEAMRQRASVGEKGVR